MRRRHILSIALTLCSALALSWDGIGHTAIARVAYGHLNPKAKAAVDRILLAQPGATKSQANFHDFGVAATWPDVIRGTKEDHPTWHYIDLPFNLDGQKGPDPDAENAVTMLDQEVNLLGHGDDATQAVALAWVEHLVGDIHQPLHCTSLFSNAHPPPQGDRGGNDFHYAGPRGATLKLHTYWDHALELGGSKDPDEIAKAIEALYVPPQPKDTLSQATYMKWAQEGQKEAKSQVYRQSKDGPMLIEGQELPSDYKDRAYSIALGCAEIAALRLAAILNEKLGG